MLRISVYSEDLINFYLGCTEEDPSSLIPNECLAVINDWITHTDQLYEKHALIIDKYAKAGAPTLKNFFWGCTEEVSAGHNPSSLILNECLAVVNDWNTHLDQLYEKNALIIDKYTSAFSDNCLNDPTYAETYPENCANVLNATTPHNL
jgi:hypothetical protein